MRLGVDALNLRNDKRGMGRIVRGVLRAAAEADVDVTLLANRPSEDDPGRYARPSRAARRGAFDVVWYPWNGIRFRAAAPALAHVHDTFALHERGNWIARRRVRAPLYEAARRARRIATDSRWSAEQIRRELHVEDERIVVIHPVPDLFFSPGEEPRDSLPSPPYVLLVGAGDPRKNARFFVEAFGDAFARAPVRLVVAGALAADAQREALARGIKLVHEERADDARLRALYRGAACVAVPSLAEGFGLVVVEAQACGAPVVASNASSLPEAAGDAAILLSPHDRVAWRDALREVVEDEDLALRLRALGVARWGPGRRDESARAILSALRDLTDQRA